MNREDLVAALEHIGWSVNSKMNGHHYQMQNHKGEISKVMLMSDHALMRDGEADLCFYYEKCHFDTIDNNCVSLYAKGSSSVFINFYGEPQEERT